MTAPTSAKLRERARVLRSVYHPLDDSLAYDAADNLDLLADLLDAIGDDPPCQWSASARPRHRCGICTLCRIAAVLYKAGDK